MSSPASAPSRRSARSGGTSPITVTEIASGPRVVSPPTSSICQRPASRKKPCANAAIHFSSASGSAIARVAQRGSAPIAARSERLTASALCPSLPGSASGKKWRPASSMSVETASVMPSWGWSSAQSSPTPSTAVGAGRVKYFRMMSNSEATCWYVPSRSSFLLSFVRTQRQSELVEHAVHVFVAVGSAERLGELDRLVDHDLVGDIGGILQLERREQQDPALDRRELLGLAIERGRDQLLEDDGVLDRAREEPREVLGVGFAEFLGFSQLGQIGRA